MTETFSVYQFFPDDTYECVRSRVALAEAVEAAKHYTSCVSARMGLTRRVIITDSGDCIVFEWKHGSGITFPKEPAGMEAAP